MNSTDNLIECLNTDKCNNLTTRNPHSFCVKKRPAQNVQKKYDINCDSWLSNCVFLPNFKDTSTGLIVDGKGKFRKQT